MHGDDVLHGRRPGDAATSAREAGDVDGGRAHNGHRNGHTGRFVRKRNALPEVVTSSRASIS